MKKIIVAGLSVLAIAAVLTGCIINGTNGNVYFEWQSSDANTIVDNTTDGVVSIPELYPTIMPTGQVFSYQYSYSANNTNTYSNSVNVQFYNKGTSGDLFTNGTNGDNVYFIVDIPTATDALANTPPSITLSDAARSIGSQKAANLVSSVVNGNTTTQVFDTGKAHITMTTTVKTN